MRVCVCFDDDDDDDDDDVDDRDDDDVDDFDGDDDAGDDGADGDHYDDDGDDDDGVGDDYADRDDDGDADDGDEDDDDEDDDDDDDVDDDDVGDDYADRDDDADADDGDEEEEEQDDDDDDDDHGDSEGQARLLGGVPVLPELSFAQNHCPALTFIFWFAREHVECHILMLFPWYGLFEFEHFFIYILVCKRACWMSHFDVVSLVWIVWIWTNFIVESTFNTDLGFPYDHVVPQVWCQQIAKFFSGTASLVHWAARSVRRLESPALTLTCGLAR